MFGRPTRALPSDAGDAIGTPGMHTPMRAAANPAVVAWRVGHPGRSGAKFGRRPRLLILRGSDRVPTGDDCAASAGVGMVSDGVEGSAAVSVARSNQSRPGRARPSRRTSRSPPAVPVARRPGRRHVGWRPEPDRLLVHRCLGGAPARVPAPVPGKATVVRLVQDYPGQRARWSH